LNNYALKGYLSLIALVQGKDEEENTEKIQGKVGQIGFRTDLSTNAHMGLQKPFRGRLVRLYGDWLRGRYNCHKTQKDFLVLFI
jgi:hypothetical protein